MQFWNITGCNTPYNIEIHFAIVVCYNVAHALDLQLIFDDVAFHMSSERLSASSLIYKMLNDMDC